MLLLVMQAESARYVCTDGNGNLMAYHTSSFDHRPPSHQTTPNFLPCIADRPRFGYYSQLFSVAYRCLLVRRDAWVGAQAPASGMLSACHCPGQALRT